jgi:hypothetical protein
VFAQRLLTRSLPEADRQAYTTAYARSGRMRAWAYLVSFQQAARDFARLSRTKLTMPVLSIGGEKANGAALGQQVQLVATNARSVTLPNTGHWVMEESPQATMDALVSFLIPSAATATASATSAQPMSQASRSALPQMRWTPDEVRVNQTGTEQVGSSFLAGVSTKVLAGDPSKPGFYTIILSVAANTTIPAHSHRDDRMATVVSGTWQFGYGDKFDEKSLKRLPPGSVYSEPGGGIISPERVPTLSSCRSRESDRQILGTSIRLMRRRRRIDSAQRCSMSWSHGHRLGRRPEVYPRQ